MYEGHDGRGANPGSNVGRGNANPQNLFLRSYKCYSPAFIGKPELERGNKSMQVHLMMLCSYYAGVCAA